ncbi:MAG TPA: hypothetical protein VM074_10020 [Solimonas sp.]|nr:hypothetical protein [Solimonas sp.]
MKMKVLAVLGAPLLALVQACGTVAYVPTEYPLREGLVAPIAAAGPVAFVNGQPSKEPTIMHSYGGTSLQSDYNAVTELMVQQAAREFAKAAQVGGGAKKTVELAVSSLNSDYSIFHWNSKIVFRARLGNGQAVDKQVTHGSGLNAIQDLNGCIAEGVMELLKDPVMRAYFTAP